MYPNVRNAPGGKMNTRMLVVSGNKAMPKILPAPKISRAQPRSVKARVNPKPQPTPSTKLDRGEFFAANSLHGPR